LRARCDALMLGTAGGVDYSQIRMVLEKTVGGKDSGGSAVGKDIGFQGPSLEYQKFQGLEHDPVCCGACPFLAKITFAAGNYSVMTGGYTMLRTRTTTLYHRWLPLRRCSPRAPKRVEGG
jgi:hypothetical protein